MSIEAGTASRKHNLLVSVRNRILRWTLNILSALSLLLCGVVIAFWIRGQFKGDWFQWHKTDPQANTWRAADMVSGRSGFYFSWQAFYFERPGHAEEYSLVLERTSRRARAIFLNSPHNPTGGVATAQDLHDLANLIRSRNVAVFSDEPYCHMVWQGKHHPMLGEPGILDQVVAAYTFSKSYSMSGWRLGYAVGGLRLIVRTRAELRRRQRLRDNQCLACGYDLRGSSGRCPECGQPANR